ncbi:Acetylornithine deacetylase/Succinyl-diaminopimelate desuccinylase [Lentzea fradiae]|uniref:Acetylornithine deacetylase/Succinyl-diaminopimelate desuccinylase n=1 Tax=Lentzea fradiae TaxID=200378 RepID=A0A1G7V8K6_9PSEU|nr:M20/M25/M40 family metallo-hydrolase [Lentzea fradiae]SDG56057.1 Acetylornithine deacetylase/Succinyl-diaminopimelate desuccinylase [Lentzea fradiae]
MTAVTAGKGLRDHVQALEFWQTLIDLVKYRSTADEPDPPLHATAEVIAGLFRSVGLSSADVITISHEGKTSAPLVYADQRSDTKGAPTVLLYAHYDVQPADETKWTVTKPFVPKEVTANGDTRLYGRGAADDKSGVVLHLGALKALRDTWSKLPINVKLVVEGEEESSSVLDSYVDAHPEDPRFQADLIIVADTGNLAVGQPALTSTLRGIVAVDVTVKTLAAEVHSGMYGGPAPDAFMTLVRLLSTLHDANGDVAVAGLTRFEHDWAPVREEQYRKDAGVEPGVGLVGTGTIAQRLFGRPSVNVVGLRGAPSMDRPANVLTPEVTARISVRLAPNQDPDAALKALREHIETHAPEAVVRQVVPVSLGQGFAAYQGPHHAAVETALKTAYKTDAVAQSGQGGSIPLVSALHAANPSSDIVLWGCEEPLANIHGNDESVSRSELEHMTLAEALLLDALAAPAR